MRQCSGCSLCCKLLAIEELNKSQFQWCKHCEPKKGCKIYSSKPKECGDFNCEYLLDYALGEEWRPNKCKIVIVREPNRIKFFVDSDYPNVWKSEPYYSTIKRLSNQLFSEMKQVTVSVGKQHVYVVLPDRDIDLGEVKDDEFITLDGRKLR